MNNPYEDIRDRIDAEPVWFDEHAVPRYCEFAPRESANIYADEVVLVEIHCQACGAAFKVCFSANLLGRYQRSFSRAAHEAMQEGRVLLQEDVSAKMETSTLRAAIESDTLHYGDPPNVFCCPAGPTMNSVPVRVLEYWHRADNGGKSREWKRVSELERDFPEEQWDDPDDEVVLDLLGDAD